MLYSIGFRDESGSICEYDGTKYIYVDYKRAEGLKAVCGEYPPKWDCRSAEYMRGVFESALSAIIEGRTGIKSPDLILLTLQALIERCEAFPHAVLEVDW